ncbi:MAG: c-type cytochrome [bacterium]
MRVVRRIPIFIGVALLAATVGSIPPASAPPPVAPSADSLQAIGKTVYDKWCAVCHGEKGDGRGPAAEALNPKPRDFTSGVYKLKSTIGSDAPLDADLQRTISEGIPGTAMPAFYDLLSRQETTNVLVYLKFFSVKTFRGVPARPYLIPPPPLYTPESVARGRAVYERSGCAQCHGDSGRGDGPSASVLTDDWGHPIRPTHLTEPWTFKGGATLPFIYLRVTLGLPGTPMPAYADTLNIEDRWHLVNYILSLRRAPLWEMTDPAAIAAIPPGGRADPVQRGNYLAHALTCRLCHNAVNDNGSYQRDMFPAGGMPVVAYPFGVWYSRNLTPDNETGIGAWSEDDFLNAFQNGRRPLRKTPSGGIDLNADGRVLSSFDMPWPLFHGMQKNDARAIYAYLRTLKPIHNQVWKPQKFGIVETVVYKAASAFFNAPLSINFHAGNAGEKEFRTPAPQSLLWLDYLVIALFVFWLYRRLFPAKKARPVRTNLYGVFKAGWSREKEGKAGGKNGWRVARFLLIGVMVIAAALVMYFLYAWPPSASMPPEKLADLIAGKLPDPVNAKTPAEKAIAERGKYLVSVSPCGMCHTAGPLWPWQKGPPPLSGGGKVNWNLFGTTYTRNITPDIDTGIGMCSIAQIKRAIRSGIRCTPDSHHGIRTMHWQDMPWDIFSNWSDEDLYAIAFYLKSIPPVVRQIPDPEPPKPGDHTADAFFIGDYSKP